jgi:tetratricopeptide (TPR) repeat protein
LVRRSTLFLSVLAALCAGLYIGRLTADLTADRENSAVTKRVLVPQKGDAREDPELKRLERAVKNNPRNAVAWAELGNWYFDRELPEEAVRAYESSLVVKPGDPDVMTDLGVMYRSLHDYDKAMELFAKASDIDPNHLQSRFNHGVVLFYDLKREEEGMRIWSELTRRAPDYVTPDGRGLADMVKNFYKNRNP